MYMKSYNYIHLYNVVLCQHLMQSLHQRWVLSEQQRPHLDPAKSRASISSLSPHTTTIPRRITRTPNKFRGIAIGFREYGDKLGLLKSWVVPSLQCVSHNFKLTDFFPTEIHRETGPVHGGVPTPPVVTEAAIKGAIGAGVAPQPDGEAPKVKTEKECMTRIPSFPLLFFTGGELRFRTCCELRG